jgi:pSer/pThr/pTyr-binding forkhead associated (FHA) protein
VIEDHGSTGGTFVNHQRITRKVLETGDVIHIAHRVMVFATSVQDDLPQQSEELPAIVGDNTQPTEETKPPQLLK